ncbi:hypothetical protein ACTNCI_07395 [Mitsuokella jalaludinii]|uniref:hypothetical protein n=1 Tax=Mitsuokella jalaludinii TaxID=187979 RepID=UPI003F8CCF37
MEDEKMTKFEEMATKRVQNALHAIRLIGNLSNRNAYHYTEEHVQQIFQSLEEAVAEEKAKFAPREKPKTTSFSFSGIQRPAAEEPAPDNGGEPVENQL